MVVLTSMLWLTLAASSGAATPPAPPKPAKAWLEILCVPSSKIYVDGRVVGQTRFPLYTTIEVMSGKHRLVCETRAGKKSPEEEITLDPGETKVIHKRVE